MNKSLLILDDSPDALFVLSEFLKDAYEIITEATTIAQANDALSQRRYTHVLVDYRIEGKTIEYNLLKRWRTLYPDIEYIAIFTGTYFERNRWPEVCDDLFQKPEDLHRLLRTLIDLSGQAGEKAASQQSRECPERAH